MPALRRFTLSLFAPVVLVMLAAAPALPAPFQEEPSVDPAESTEPVAPEARLEEEQRRLLEAEGDDAQLARFASRLLEEGRQGVLRRVLSGDEERAILATLGVLRREGPGGLLDAILRLAARPERSASASLAESVLIGLARERDDVVAFLAGWLRDAPREPSVRRVAIRTLGHSRHLAAMEPLIAELGGLFSRAAQDALVLLTGHRPGPDAAAWQTFRVEHAGWSREILLETALEQERRDSTGLLAAMREEVVQARTELMGQEVPLLVAGLTNEYAEVRLVAAAGLAGHPNPEAAAGAVRDLLRVLGHGAEDGGGEADPSVRAVMVRCLGKLGWSTADVQSALTDELRHGDAGVREAAVDALARVREVPSIVGPLLDVLQRADGREALLATALETVAGNRPGTVLGQLQPWLGPDQPARVRAAAARAVLACDDLDAALTVVEGMRLDEAESTVRYAVARALGDRVRTLSGQATDRRRITSILADLAGDVDPSVRAEAVSSLGETGERVALALLEQRAGVETDLAVLERIVDALGELKLPAGVAAVGRICAQDDVGHVTRFEATAQQALASIGEDRDTELWVRMADTLAEVTAWNLATWCYAQVEQRFEAMPEAADLIDLARGRRAEVLVHAGQPAAARTLLLELHEADAPVPSLPDRLELLAVTHEALGDYDAAAGYYLDRLRLIPEGSSGRFAMQRSAVRTLQQANRPAEALPLLDELHAAHPADNDLMFRLARVQEELGRWEEASATANRLLERIPDESAALRQEVQTMLQRLRSLAPDSEDPSP